MNIFIICLIVGIILGTIVGKCEKDICVGGLVGLCAGIICMYALLLFSVYAIENKDWQEINKITREDIVEISGGQVFEYDKECGTLRYIAAESGDWEELTRCNIEVRKGEGASRIEVTSYKFKNKWLKYFVYREKDIDKEAIVYVGD